MAGAMDAAPSKKSFTGVQSPRQRKPLHSKELRKGLFVRLRGRNGRALHLRYVPQNSGVPARNRPESRTRPGKARRETPRHGGDGLDVALVGPCRSRDCHQINRQVNLTLWHSLDRRSRLLPKPPAGYPSATGQKRPEVLVCLVDRGEVLRLVEIKVCISTYV